MRYRSPSEPVSVALCHGDDGVDGGVGPEKEGRKELRQQRGWRRRRRFGLGGNERICCWRQVVQRTQKQEWEVRWLAERVVEGYLDLLRERERKRARSASAWVN